MKYLQELVVVLNDPTTNSIGRKDRLISLFNSCDEKASLILSCQLSYLFFHFFGFGEFPGL
jgi:hypothetical protein